MKLKATLAAAALLLAPSLHAFTLDFSAYVGQVVPPSLVVNVPGYGNVAFSAGMNALTGALSSFQVGTSFFGTPSIQFDNGESLSVSFLDGPLTNVDFITVAVSADTSEHFSVVNSAPGQYSLTLQNSTNGAGLAGVEFVPEPTSALLGLIGASSFVIRRRRN